MKVTDAIVSILIEYGVKHVFGYTGGSIADLIDSIYKASPAIKFIENRHEQASAFAANAYANVTGNLGVAISSSGPGAINLLNGIANAYYDSLPCVFITGNVHTLGRKKSERIRQNAFQETDIVQLARDITKASFYVNNADEIQDIMVMAIEIAMAGRQGPVLIDIPYDVQRKDIVFRENNKTNKNTSIIAEIQKIAQSEEILDDSKRPIVLIGGGCQSKREDVADILNYWNIPIVASMRGIDVIPHDNEYYVGVIGSYGNRYANLAMYYSDCILVLGSRLDERQIGYKKNEFAPHAKIIQVDIDEYELGKKVVATVEIKSDVAAFCKQISKHVIGCNYDEWLQVIKSWKKRYSSVNSKKGIYSANRYLNLLSKYASSNTVFTTDVGLNQVCSMQALFLRKDMRLLCSAGLGAMGYSLPAAIGAFFAGNNSIVSINGDGGLQMNIQELQTIKQYNIPIKIVVINNNCLGMIRSLQTKMFSNRYYASLTDYSAPNWGNIAAAFDMEYLLVDTEYCYDVMKKAFVSDKNSIIEFQVGKEMLPNPDAGSDINSQIPPLDDYELQRIQSELRGLR